ncbi:MAG: hypothetical protein BWZ10_01509 [candidate division BRC1 bacterium ADurb.BinA364]|nr:MAG: hypothetical protein BWZ10_01509 [candidate division BRC1 bacterium ADurb.BinA364]
MIRIACAIAAAAICFDASAAERPLPKWNPGHYMLVFTDAPAEHLDTIRDSAFQGAQIRYYWRDLEPEKDKYDFSRIEADLARLQTMGKRLVMQLMDRRFHSPERPLPDYLYDDPVYGGGAEPYVGKTGSVARLWDSEVLQRKKALIAALGRRFDSEPFFEGFCFEETAIAIDKQNAAGFTHQGYLDALKQLVSAACAAFPNSTVIEYANWLAAPEGALDELARHCHACGAGWGGPDVVPDNAPGRPAGKSRIKGYAIAEQYAGKMPLGYAVQTPTFGGKEGTYTLDEIYDMGVNRLRLNYMFWIRVEGPAYSHSFTRDVLPFINAKQGKINAERPENRR